jgi:hypothetical protein
MSWFSYLLGYPETPAELTLALSNASSSLNTFSSQLSPLVWSQLSSDPSLALQNFKRLCTETQTCLTNLVNKKLEHEVNCRMTEARIKPEHVPKTLLPRTEWKKIAERCMNNCPNIYPIPDDHPLLENVQQLFWTLWFTDPLKDVQVVESIESNPYTNLHTVPAHLRRMDANPLDVVNHLREYIVAQAPVVFHHIRFEYAPNGWRLDTSIKG